MTGSHSPLNKWCVPPICWIQRVFVPPRTDDWNRVGFQPMLYLGTFIAALIVLIFGDFSAAMPGHPGMHSDRDFGVYWIWTGMSLIAPPMGLGSLWMIQNREWVVRYRGKWLRLSSDIFQFTAMAIYLILRISWGDYHVYPVAVLGMSTLFVAHLIMRDIHDLIHNERLATKLHRNGHANR